MCSFTFIETHSIASVYNGQGNLYYIDKTDGILYVKLIQQFDDSVGRDGKWIQPNQSLNFSRNGLMLPVKGLANLTITATNCGNDPVYCDKSPIGTVPPSYRLLEKRSSQGSSKAAIGAFLTILAIYILL